MPEDKDETAGNWINGKFVAGSTYSSPGTSGMLIDGEKVAGTGENMGDFTFGGTYGRNDHVVIDGSTTVMPYVPDVPNTPYLPEMPDMPNTLNAQLAAMHARIANELAAQKAALNAQMDALHSRLAAMHDRLSNQIGALHGNWY
jgi:hypothetical protein